MKRFDYQKFIAAVIVALFVLFSNGTVILAQKTMAGTTVFNFAEASYTDDNGASFNAVSPTVSFTVRAISALNVTPDETEPSAVVAANEAITRQFRVCNTGNGADSYTLIRVAGSAPAQIAEIYFDADADGVISSADILATVGATRSPLVDPDSCIGVLVNLNTQNIAANERLNINITARSNASDAAGGAAENDGTIINTAGKSAIFTDPNNPSLAPSKTVEGKAMFAADKNQPVRYLIALRNNGDVPARNVVVTDDLPAGLQYIAGSMQLDARSITDADDGDEGIAAGSRLVVRLANPVAPGQTVRVGFQSMVVADMPPGTGVVNSAVITASNSPQTKTTDAIVVVDPFGTVYAARAGASMRIPGARVAISTERTSENLLRIPENQGFNPNLANANPYSTDSRGRFSFGLLPEHLGSLNQPQTYFVTVTAPDFRSRLLQISLSPNGNGLFKMLVRALDEMPLAVAGGFDLTASDVEIGSIADIAFNIPMFENSVIELTKTADRAQAEIGDVVTYRVEVRNRTVAPLFDAIVSDTLPDSFNYAENTARVERVSGVSEAIEPIINGKTMQFRFAELRSGENLSIVYRVRVGVNAREGDQYNSAAVGGHFPSGEAVQTAPVRVAVRIGAGVFSMRQIIVGRVFVDANGNQMFDKGEQPVVGARVYLANGDSVIADSQGMYNLPAVSDGAQVVALDALTLPEGYVLADGGSRSGKDWTRLLRTPLGGGGMLRQNFVLVASKAHPPVSGKEKNENVTDDTETIKNGSLKESQTVNANLPKDEASKTKNEAAVKFKPVAPGEVFVHALENNQVVMSPAVNLDISVAREWSAQVELNNQKFGADNIGQTREDRANQITTYSLVGLGLKPGPNKLRVTAISPTGAAGKTSEITVYGRGAARRLVVTAERRELQASGRDATGILVRAFDEWENPAQDASLMIQTTGGRFLIGAEWSKNTASLDAGKIVVSRDARESNGAAAEQVSEIKQQQSINLVEGVAFVKLISDNRTGTAQIRASLGATEAQTEIRFTPEMRPAILVSLAEVAVGGSAPETVNRGSDETVGGHVQFFYRGGLFKSKNLLTLGYDSRQSLNRVAGRDRLFQLNPLDRAYPIFGDSSVRFQETESNSRVYARIDRDRSYAMFGDFTADMEQSRLVGYGRKLTGVKIHAENGSGDFVTVTGARPDSSFARQIIPGGSFGLVQLAYPDVLSGSEVLAIETRDRRSPELVLSREILVRSLDYNIDSTTGTIFFLRPISTFDRDLNLVQIVATYEYRSTGMESSVYTARAGKTFNSLGLWLGLSYVDQRQAESRTRPVLETAESRMARSGMGDEQRHFK